MNTVADCNLPKRSQLSVVPILAIWNRGIVYFSYLLLNQGNKKVTFIFQGQGTHNGNCREVRMKWTQDILDYFYSYTVFFYMRQVFYNK